MPDFGFVGDDIPDSAVVVSYNPILGYVTKGELIQRNACGPGVRWFAQQFPTSDTVAIPAASVVRALVAEQPWIGTAGQSWIAWLENESVKKPFAYAGVGKKPDANDETKRMVEMFGRSLRQGDAMVRKTGGDPVFLYDLRIGPQTGRYEITLSEQSIVLLGTLAKPCTDWVQLDDWRLLKDNDPCWTKNLVAIARNDTMRVLGALPHSVQRAMKIQCSVKLKTIEILIGTSQGVVWCKANSAAAADNPLNCVRLAPACDPMSRKRVNLPVWTSDHGTAMVTLNGKDRCMAELLAEGGTLIEECTMVGGHRRIETISVLDGEV